MKRRTLLAGMAAALAATPLTRSHAQQKTTIRWWYHFDDAKATPDPSRTADPQGSDSARSVREQRSRILQARDTRSLAGHGC